MPRSAPLLVLASLAACTPVLHAPPARLFPALGLGVATPPWDPPEVRLEIDTDERTETIMGVMQPGLHVRASGGLEFASGATFSPRLQIDATFLETIGEPPGLFRGDSWLLGASVGVRFSGTTEPSRREWTGAD